MTKWSARQKRWWIWIICTGANTDKCSANQLIGYRKTRCGYMRLNSDEGSVSAPSRHHKAFRRSYRFAADRGLRFAAGVEARRRIVVARLTKWCGIGMGGIVSFAAQSSITY